MHRRYCSLDNHGGITLLAFLLRVFSIVFSCDRVQNIP
uniref:Uncharacterized protein n=1 Tax=Arundo donax TaxID=35708 RepID=A0A0A9HFE2_ARUDO